MPEYRLKTKQKITIEKEYLIDAPTRFEALDLWSEDRVDPYDEIVLEDSVEQIVSVDKLEGTVDKY